jgi:hypothetical protein
LSRCLTLRSLIALTIVATVACFTFDLSREEVSRATAPGGAIDAVVVETNTGASGAFGYEVHVVTTGTPAREDAHVARLYAAVRSDSAYGVNVRWLNTDELRIQYLRADNATVRESLTVVASRRIRIALDSGVTDLLARRGGMLWNLRGRP